MAHNIIIDCFHFTIKKRYTDGSEQKTFLDIFKTFLAQGQTIETDLNNAYLQFYSDFRNYMGTSFKLNQKETKALAIHTDDLNQVSHSKRTITGVFRGGSTGIEKTIHERNQVSNGDNLDQLKISATPCFFKIWTPPDSNFGIAIVQSYGNEKLGGLFLDQFHRFLSTKGFGVFQTKKILPTDLIRTYKNNSIVKSITINKSALVREKREALNPMLVDLDNLKVDLVLKGFGSRFTWSQIEDYLKRNNNVFLGVEVDEIGMDEGYDTIIEYNYHGRSARGKMSTGYNVIPSLIVNSEITVQANGHPDLTSLNTYCNNLLDDLLVEIGYTVTEDEY